MTLLEALQRRAFAALVLLGAGSVAKAAEPVKLGDTMKGVHNARYCEIIPIVREGVPSQSHRLQYARPQRLPHQICEVISEDAMKERFGALMVLMNGPRYFLMDEITASGATASGKTIGVDGMELTERASIDLGLFDLLHRLRSARSTTQSAPRMPAPIS